jgi:predicted esterase
MILAPATATWAPRSLFVIHRNGDTAAGFSHYWRPLVNEGWTLIIPQSSRPCAGGTGPEGTGFCWDDAVTAVQELRVHLEECQRKRGLGPDGMIIAGTAEGARLALEIAGEGGLPWLCVTPLLSTPFDARSLTAVPSRTKGAFLLGGAHADRDHTRFLIRDLESSGVDITIRVMEEAGDDLPEDFATIAAGLLRPLIGDPAVP